MTRMSKTAEWVREQVEGHHYTLGTVLKRLALVEIRLSQGVARWPFAGLLLEPALNHVRRCMDQVREVRKFTRWVWDYGNEHGWFDREVE